MARTTWATYCITGYTHQVGTDSRATGGVHLHQIRCTRANQWLRRIVDSTGRYRSAGLVSAVSASEGEAMAAMAADRQL